MSTITTIQESDLITNSRADINNNFSALNTDKIETSTLDTDTTLAAASDSKIATQKAVKAYVDSGGNQNASETNRGLVQEATDAQVTAGTATGSSGAKLFVSPTKLLTRTDAIIPVDSGYVPGATVLFSNDAEKSFTDGTYTKLKEIQINAPVALLRIVWRFYVPVGSNGGTKVYLNGVAVSSEVVGTAPTWVDGSHDIIQLYPGDLVQLYGYRSIGSGTLKIDNFRLAGELSYKYIYYLNSHLLNSAIRTRTASTTNTVSATNTLT
jgi:hypothetical protein